jgi:hypothetical protein
MKELDLGSSYNPFGDPLVHIPYQLRIDAMSSPKGGASAIHDQPSRNARNVRMKDKDTGAEVVVFPSVQYAAAEIDMPKETLRMRLRRAPVEHEGYILEYVE